jgi:DtxR family Mn-dependent transcriptional regulator
LTHTNPSGILLSIPNVTNAKCAEFTLSTPSVEDYVKAIYKAQLASAEVTTQQIAERVGVSAPAVSKMLRRLTALNLVAHTKYMGVQLTAAGEKIALEIVRHHRLLEQYLVQALGYTWDNVHDEAERLEHHISEEFEERIDALLGYPRTCPHGDPIPGKDGTVVAVPDRALATQIAQAPLLIQRVSDKDAGLLRHLKTLGLLPGTAIEFLEQEPYGGSFLVRVGDEIVRVSPLAAEQIYVSD